MAKIKVQITEYIAETQVPKKVKDWVIAIDKFMLDSGCRVEGFASGRFQYTSRKSKKSVCVIYVGADGCGISMRGNHFVLPNDTSVNNILDELPETKLNSVMDGIGCEVLTAIIKGDETIMQRCLKKDYSVNPEHKCAYGIADVFGHNGVKSFRCGHNPGVYFNLDESTDFGLIKKWIVYEIAWKAV